MKAIAKTIVTDTNTARTVKSGNLDVFSTPMMIALMEQAACVALEETLEVGQTSVGTKVNIEHIAASRVGSEIIATAVIDEIDGRKVEFTVIARDDIKEIGKGKHTRFIVDAEKFMAKIK